MVEELWSAEGRSGEWLAQPKKDISEAQESVLQHGLVSELLERRHQV